MARSLSPIAISQQGKTFLAKEAAAAGIAQGPWRVAAADVYVAGVQDGEGFVAGQRVGDVFVAGAQKGEAHG